MKEPVDHILRPQLPWRESQNITECGYDASKVKTLTRTEYFQREKDLGQQRNAMFTCMTCASTATRYVTWDEDPRRALEREIIWECSYRGSERGIRLRDELLSIAALIESHQEEFNARILEFEQRRGWLEKKAASERARAEKNKHPKLPGGL